MDKISQASALQFADNLAAEGVSHFTFREAQRWLSRSSGATGNLLKRMLDAGLIDRVRRGHYVLRPLGVLGTPSAAEDVALAVGAAFRGIPHRIGYRSALDEHDLITHPSRSIQVATIKRIRAKTLSGRSLYVVRERESAILTGAVRSHDTWVSGMERALLDAAARPGLVGGVAVLAEAIVTAGEKVDPNALTRYAQELGWRSALRRIGSIADALDVKGLAGQLAPLEQPTADLDLEPGRKTSYEWRDKRWHMRWPQSPDELAAVTHQ
jgi:predicted transcriptional regulator of viral defense system